MMSEDPNLLPVPYGGSNERPKPPTSGPMLDEVRVLTSPEIRRGRHTLIWISLFLTAMALVAPVDDLTTGEWSLLPVHVTRLLISLVVIVCLVRALPKVQYFTAIIIVAGAAANLLLLFWAFTTRDVPLIVSSAISVMGYGMISLVLATSSNIRGYLGYRRAKKRHKRETRERKHLQRIVSYQAGKTPADHE